MENTLVLLALVCFGVTFGSFAGAQVWRLRASQLTQDKRAGLDIDEREYKRLAPLVGHKTLDDRSRCLECHQQLRWYDLVPVISWLSTGGKCRYCHKSIGWFEITIESATSLLLVLSYPYWPLNLVTPLELMLFFVWICSCVPLVVLFFYDLKWQILPLRYNIAYIVIATIMLMIRSMVSEVDIFSTIGAVAILGGLYALLYAISKNWVGDADRILGIGLGLILADWRLAFIALFIANLTGCIVVLFGMIAGKVDRKSSIALGPLLIIGTLVSFFFGHQIIEWFMFAQQL